MIMSNMSRSFSYSSLTGGGLFVNLVGYIGSRFVTKCLVVNST
jgi:hypothetical protein